MKSNLKFQVQDFSSAEGKKHQGFFAERMMGGSPFTSETYNPHSETMPNGRIILDKEVNWDKTKTLMSKTDKSGNIEYANDAFIDVSGYEDFELIGTPHSIIRHPDMPKVVFKLLWDALKKGENFYAVVKNLAKSGRYYWVITTFEIVRNDAGEITNYIGYRKSVPKEVINNVIEPLYKRLLKIEQVNGVELSEKFLKGMLEQEGKTYVEYITEVMMKHSEKEKSENKKGFFARFFGR